MVERVRKRLEVTGIVQGVGFRPTIYRLALEHKLTGFIRNDGQGVWIEVEGPLATIAEFIVAIRAEAPPLSRIDQIRETEQSLRKEASFTIVSSAGGPLASVSISPDQGLCDNCLEETLTPGNRHYLYPFTNCTHCGPRYSLINSLPYDRQGTSMAGFAMCPACRDAYENPLDRRYHAQPVSCNCCGPQVYFTDATGKCLADRTEAIEAAATAIANGQIIAVKGVGGFHLLCDATQTEVVARLRAGKRRPRKPLALLARNLEMALCYVSADEREQALLSSRERPITLLRKKSASGLADNIAPGVPWLGVMLAYTPLHHLLLRELAVPLIATSANRSGLPIITEGAEVVEQLGEMIDGVLDHNRAIVYPCDDAVVQIAGGQRQIVRLGRGYAPFLIPLPEPVAQPVLALGAQQKCGIALARGRQMIIGPYQGDIDNIDLIERYHFHQQQLCQLFSISPKLVISDLHPGYSTTLQAQEISATEGIVHRQVQHHHAHILAVMAEYQLTEEVLGFTFDGTGFGDPDDTGSGKIWGGEVLLAGVNRARRCHHLQPFRLIGGERAIQEPARILLALLLEHYTLDEIIALDIPAFRKRPASWLNNLYRIWQNPQSSPLTSSMGRLIDGWASLLGLVDTVDFDGESGLCLEQVALDCRADACLDASFELDEKGVIGWQGLLAWSLKQDLECAGPIIAATLLRGIAALVETIAERYPHHKVIVSGGVFQNRVLMDALAERFQIKNRELLRGTQLPLNDGGIAAGQLWHGLMSTVEKH